MSDIEVALKVIQASDGRQTYVRFSERADTDPRSLAKKIVAEDMTESEKMTFIAERHSRPLAQAVYPLFAEYVAAVEEAISEWRFPGSSIYESKWQPVFGQLPGEPLAPGPGPAHDLSSLFVEMLEKGVSILGSQQGTEIWRDQVVVRWTERTMKGKFGDADWNKNSIRVNCLLDSPDVSVETVRFLLWHEFLHIYREEGHTPEFRQLERQWPGAIEADHELDTLDERFNIRYW
jgi:hypothetical protein